MFRLFSSRIISTGRITIKSSGFLSYPSCRFLSNYNPQSNGNDATTATVSINRSKNEESIRKK